MKAVVIFCDAGTASLRTLQRRIDHIALAIGAPNRNRHALRKERTTCCQSAFQRHGARREIILGKEPQIRMAMCCILARGHLLIEDVPGVARPRFRMCSPAFSAFNTSAFSSPATSCRQTSSVSPIFERDRQVSFSSRPCVFASDPGRRDQSRLAQSAKRAPEAMEENQVTADGKTMKLLQPFFVIATQNPSHQVGTFPLPESQLDRFMRIRLGYPDHMAERALLKGEDRRDLIAKSPRQWPSVTWWRCRRMWATFCI